VLERARTDGPVPSLGAVEFVAKASDRGAADRETMESIQQMAFDQGAEPALLSRKFRDVAFPEDDGERGERLRTAIAQAARRLSTLIAEEGAPVPKKLAIKVEETVGELLAEIDSN
jgi:hypothetical protein